MLSDRARSLFGTASPDTRERTERLPSRYVFGSVAQRSTVAATTTDAEVLALATRPEESDKVRLAAISNPQVDRRSLRDALASQDAAERAAAHANSSTPIARLRAAVGDPDHHVAVATIENPRTPDTAIRRALNSPKKKVRRAATLALLDRGDTGKRVLGHPDPELRALVATNTADVAVRDALLADRRPEVRARAVLNSRIIAPLPLTVADDLDHRVTLAAARRTRDPRLLHRLGRSDELMTRQAVLANPATATATRDAMGRSLDPRLAEVLADPTRIDRAEHAAVAHATTDSRVLELLSHDRRDEVRRAVIANPQTPRAVVERIASGTGDVPDFARRILRAERDESGAVSREHHLGDLLG